jgi:hypothetical protein
MASQADAAGKTLSASCMGIMKGWMQGDCATSCTATPGNRLNRTAVALKSLLYRYVVLGPGFGIGITPDC